jgi:hypothetical protein
LGGLPILFTGPLPVLALLRGLIIVIELLFIWFGDSNGKRSSEVTGEIVTGCVMDNLFVLFA